MVMEGKFRDKLNRSLLCDSMFLAVVIYITWLMDVCGFLKKTVTAIRLIL